MKYTNVYKLVTTLDKGETLVSWLVCPSHMRIFYKPFKWAKPIVKGSHLLAFPSLEASRYILSHLMPYEQLWLARAVVVTNKIGDLMLVDNSGNPIKNNGLFSILPGTIGCSRIKLLERVL